MGDAIKYLYRQLILRDVLSFITPGTIVVITAFLLFLPEPCLSQRLATLFEYSKSIHWLLYIPIFGLFYMVGFAVQCFGELVGIIRFSPYGENERSWCKRWSMFCCSFDKNYKKHDESNIWWWEEEEEISAFYERSADNEGMQQGHERLVVLKQMCANGFTAILIAATLIAVNHFWPDVWRWLLLSWFVVLLASLFWGFRVAMLKQYTRERVFRERRGRRQREQR